MSTFAARFHLNVLFKAEKVNLVTKWKLQIVNNFRIWFVARLKKDFTFAAPFEWLGNVLENFSKKV